ncbi:MAG: hypothetical protein J1F37_04405 [Oscillospiraceae bacterium]|nr:hypothetical protein [Oscillospiraceae bacterium]
MKYKVFYHHVRSEFKSFISAGILVKDDDGGEIRRMFDISTDFKALKKLIKSLNVGRVHLEHLDCILEDYYTEHY